MPIRWNKLCLSCKSNYESSHNIISYNHKNYICENHQKYYNSYCQNCKINICNLCITSHQNHEIIKFNDKFSKIDNIIKEFNEIRGKIDELYDNIEQVKEKIDIKKYKNIPKLENESEIFYNNINSSEKSNDEKMKEIYENKEKTKKSLIYYIRWNQLKNIV